MKIRNIYLRDGGYWYGKMVGGRRTWVNLRTRDPREAAILAMEYQAKEIERRDSGGDLAAIYCAKKRRDDVFSERSAESAIEILRRIPGDPRKIGAGELQRWLDSMGGLSPWTIGGYYNRLRAFFSWMAAGGIRPDNPMLSVKVRRPPSRPLRRWLRVPEVARLIGSAPDDDLRFVLFAGFHAGFRRLEIVEARADWFDVAARRIHVRKTPTFRPKDRDERSLPMTVEFAAFLSGFLDGLDQDDYAMRPDVERGTWRYRYDFRRPFTQHAAAMGVGWLTPHGMRHSFACNLASAGVSIYKIAEWLGDGVAVVQRHYARVDPDDGGIDALGAGSEFSRR